MKNLNSKSVSGKNLFPVNRFRRVVVLLLSVTISLATLGMMGSFINRMGKATTAYAQEEVSILAAPVQQTSGSEYIQNGDFEAGFSNWETSANASWSATGGFPNGRAAISLYESISQTIPSGNETGIYRLSYNAIGSHGVYWVKATITIESSDQNTAVASQVTGELTNSSWVTGTMDLLLVSGETYTLTFKTTSTGLSNRTTYLDNISLQKYVDVEDMDTGVITNGEFIGSTGWDYSAGASFGATGGMTTTQLGAALILKAGGGWITQTNGFAISGTQPVTYQLSLDCISVNGSYGAVGYHRLESSDLNESPKEVGLNCNNAPSGWTHNEVFFTLTPGNTYTYSARYGWGAGAVSGFWLDNVSLVKFEPIKDSMVVNKETTCTGTGDQSGTQGIILDPINPRNGNFMYLKQDIVMPVAGCLLEFQRAYASDTIDYYTSTMGYGWTHNYDMRLHFADTAIPGTVEVQTPSGSRLPFYDNGDGTYTPYAGVTAELVEIGSTYVITGFNQKVYTFDAQGLLLEQADPYGNVITFTYNTNDQLIQAGQGNRTLSYAYDGSDRLTSVMDNLNREITLEYNTHGDLITVTNTLGLATTYEYSGATHLLTKVTDPSGTVLEETAYDNEGRAYRQWDGEGNLLGEIDYSIANTRVVTENGVVMTYTYDTRNTLVGIEYACTDGTAGCQVGSSIAYDGNFKQDDVVDLNGNPTTLDWNEGGSNLEYVKDALDNETFLAYDQYNNLTQTIDARDNSTQYFYDNPSFPTFLTRMTNALDKTTYYTPTTTLDGVPGLLKQQEDPDGRITTYTYNDFGQITEVVVAAGTSDAVTTAYGYDAVGRLITTTQSSVTESHTNLNVYDDGDRLVATVANWDGVLDWQNCSFAAGPREENVCTLYGYDDAGRIISTTNALGQTNLTFYDGAGRTFLSVTNWDGSSYNAANPLPDLCNFSNPDPEFNLCRQTEYDEFGRVYTTTNTLGHQSVNEYDSLGRVSRTVTNWQDGVFNPNDPDGDIETLYEYDANGNVLVVTDTVGRMTRTFYDALNRVQGTITNWDGSTTLANCSSLPTMRDNNICTQYEYDEVGNTIIVTDTLGRMTRTFYDDLNRVKATVVNWQPTLTSPNSCVLSATNDALENICTLYGYDDAGNQITTTNALNQTSLTVYDSANRPFLTVRNWDGTTTIDDESDCSFPPAVSDTNVCSVTYFDELGRRSGSKDALGNVTDYEYDGLGRLITTTRYLQNGTVPVETVIEYDALGNRLTQTDAEGNDISFVYDELNRMETSTTEEGVTQTNYYNAAGWVTQTVDTLNHATTFGYDDFGRRLTVTDAETNVTQYEYDALGNQTAMIDAETIRTTYEYDDLNRLERVIENDVPGSNPTSQSDVVTEYSYDALGNRVHITDALGITNTHTTYDVLNRPTIVEDALGNQTETLYNALGYRTVMTDGNEAVTTYGYDGLNRLTTINYLADGVTVQYQYDALGNRTAMTDSLGTTSYEYDDLYRLTAVTDPFTAIVGYGYDKVGNRTSLIYPDQRMVTYTYDMDNRLETVLDWDTGTTTYEYDLAGRLITTTLPNGVVSVNTFDDANRLTNLSHTSSNDVLIADFAYELDKVGNRTTVTETIRQPGALVGVTAFLEENGQLVLEAESGTATGGTTHDWNSQTAQTDYAGTAYMRALPDIGQKYDASATANSPGLNFTVQIDNPGSYTVWARGMAPDAAGDSLHVGVNDGTPTTATNLTGFAPIQWTWSRLTMSNTNATVDLSSSGTYTLNVWLAEDGLRLDKLLLVTDTATIPTGQGPLESPTTTALPPLGSHTIVYDYDDLYRLTDATYGGDITATYSYVYDAVGNMEAYTETIGTETSSVNRQFDDANQLLVSTDTELGTTSFYYDGNGNLDQILPPGVNPGEAGEQLYSFDQRNLITQYRVGAGSSVYDTVAEYVYDGDGNRLQQIDSSGTTPITTTYTNDNAGMSQVLVSDDGTMTTANLFGLDLIQQDGGSEMRMLLVDGLGSARVEMVGNSIETAATYEPYGKLLAQSGDSGTVYGYTGEQYDAATSLVFLRARYYNPYLNQFQSRDPFPGYAKLPQSQNGFSYVGNNPTNYIDPSGLRRCTPQEAAVDFEACDQNQPLTDSSNLFNYNVIPGSPGGSVIAYLQVNYQTLPWREYAKPQAPGYPILIPIRHPLNLDEEDRCDSMDEVAAYYSGGGFTDWEVNARNILAELHGVIDNQEEWALRDAIGVAYNPYNRIQWNEGVRSGEINSHDIFHGRKGLGASDPDLDFLSILLAPGKGGQFAVGNYVEGSYTKALNPGQEGVGNANKVYEFSLVVAYGVSKAYFYDTSYGAVFYVHRQEIYGQTGPAFYYKRPEHFGWLPYSRSSAELAANRGWPDDWEWR